MQETHPTTTTFSIDAATTMGTVTLRVADLDRSIQFYETVLRLRTIDRTESVVHLGAASGPALLTLHAMPGIPPSPQRATGLYHFAIVLPSRPDLGRMLTWLGEANIPLGQSDHLVSEALYLSDPDNNGIEIYRDRPRDTWHWDERSVRMAVDPLDLPAIIAEGADLTWDVMPAGTQMGHVHLRVGDIAQASQFYHTILGFDITATMPSALFVSAGGYHHHLGLNTWHSRGLGAAPHDKAGLQSFAILLPNRDALAQVTARLAAYHIPTQTTGDVVAVDDPWGNTALLIVAA